MKQLIMKHSVSDAGGNGGDYDEGEDRRRNGNGRGGRVGDSRRRGAVQRLREGWRGMRHQHDGDRQVAPGVRGGKDEETGGDDLSAVRGEEGGLRAARDGGDEGEGDDEDADEETTSVAGAIGGFEREADEDRGGCSGADGEGEGSGEGGWVGGVVDGDGGFDEGDLGFVEGVARDIAEDGGAAKEKGGEGRRAEGGIVRDGGEEGEGSDRGGGFGGGYGGGRR